MKLHGRGTRVESLLGKSSQKEGETFLYSVFMQKIFVVIPRTGRAEFTLPGLVKLPQRSARKGELVVGKY